MRTIWGRALPAEGVPPYKHLGAASVALPEQRHSEMTTMMHKVLTLLQAVSIAALVATTMYPHEWGALTNAGKSIQESLQLPEEDYDSVGFNERYNLVLGKTDDTGVSVHQGAGTKTKITYIYEVKCDRYLADTGEFKSHCKQIKLERLLFAAAIAAVVFFKIAEQMNVQRKVGSVQWTKELSSMVGTAMSIVVLALAARMCHIFRTDTDSIGSLNKHGSAYFGLTVTFSAVLVIASVGVTVIDRMGGSASSSGSDQSVSAAALMSSFF